MNINPQHPLSVYNTGSPFFQHSTRFPSVLHYVLWNRSRQFPEDGMPTKGILALWKPRDLMALQAKLGSTQWCFRAAAEGYLLLMTQYPSSLPALHLIKEIEHRHGGMTWGSEKNGAGLAGRAIKLSARHIHYLSTAR